MKFDIKKHISVQEVISTKNVYLNHLVKHQRKYLILLLLIVLGIPLFSNYLQNEPLIMGGESYYHLSQTKTISIYEEAILLSSIRLSTHKRRTTS